MITRSCPPRGARRAAAALTAVLASVQLVTGCALVPGFQARPAPAPVEPQRPAADAAAAEDGADPGDVPIGSAPRANVPAVPPPLPAPVPVAPRPPEPDPDRLRELGAQLERARAQAREADRRADLAERRVAEERARTEAERGRAESERLRADALTARVDELQRALQALREIDRKQLDRRP